VARFLPVIALLTALPLLPQTAQQSMPMEDYQPKSTLVVPEHILKRAKYPFIDVHNHQWDTSPAHLSQLLADMDAMNMQVLVDSPVMNGCCDWMSKAVANIRAAGKGRFVVMTNIDYRDLDAPGYSARAAAQLERDIQAGAVALKVWKNLGMMMNDSKGQRIHVDDARFDAVWEMCAKYHIPVMIHTADPRPLFQPMDKYNERWLELKTHPNRSQAPGAPSWETLIEEQHNLFARHPRTIFIDAHMGWLANDLGQLGALLDRLPNVYVEIGAISSELGRQPRSARAFFEKYQDRVLFGKDAYVVPEYWTYFRLLETADEYFDPTRRYHGLWELYGLDLPEPVLKKLYYKNALRLFPAISHAGFPN
jgi:predicted TIM-barrel fold metal-dependent hydrolase